jgi:CHAT domain-containing protein/lipopolysaccharide biosynthesis regulator YciM
MRSILSCICFLFFFSVSQSAFAQHDPIQQELNDLKAKDSLGNWIYARLDYVAKNPTARFSLLMDTEKKLWRQPKTEAEKYVFMHLLNSKGYYLLLNGDILGSINAYENAFAYYRKNKLSDYEIVEYTLKPLSNNYTRLGDYERALYLQQLSINFLIQTKDKPEQIAALYCNLAISFRSMSNLSAAEKSIQAGLKLVTPNAEVNIILNNILADVLLDQKAYTKAANLIEANIRKQKSINSGTAYYLMSSYTSAGEINVALKRYAAADASFVKAIRLIDQYDKGARLREKANILIERGNIKLLQHQPIAALYFFNQTLQTLRLSDKKNTLSVQKIYGDNKLVAVFEQLAAAYQQLGQTKESIKYLKLALYSADKIRSEYADNITRERLQSEIKTIVEKTISTCYLQYEKTKDKSLWDEILVLAEQSKSRTLLDQIKRNQQLIAVNNNDSLFIKKRALEQAIIYREKEELEGNLNSSAKSIANIKYELSLVDKEIKAKYKQFNSSDSELNLQQLQSNLPNQRIIEYFIGAENGYLIDIQNRVVKQVIRIENVKKLAALISAFADTYYRHGPNAMLNSPKQFFYSSNEIYHTLLGKVKLNTKEPMIIIPDGVLGYLSFDGFLTSNKYHQDSTIASWPFLIKQHMITYAFSLNTLLANKPKPNLKRFTGLFITHEANKNTPLVAVQQEADAIKKLVSGNFIMNESVSALSFQKAYEESKVLHIGTHAYLYGKNQEPTLDFGKEKLFLFELSAKKSAPSLVVLSACRTADGMLANGEGIISLSRGFNAIGTSATIAGLWNVNDVAASVITGRFYENLLKGEQAGMALHNAKLAWLQPLQKKADFYNMPYYWDSLIFLGSDQKIDLRPATNPSVVYLIGALLVIVTGIFVFGIRKKKNN